MMTWRHDDMIFHDRYVSTAVTGKKRIDVMWIVTTSILLTTSSMASSTGSGVVVAFVSFPGLKAA